MVDTSGQKRIPSCGGTYVLAHKTIIIAPNLQRSFLQQRMRKLTNTHCAAPHGTNNRNTVIYIKKYVIITNSVEWMKGICHTWSRGRHFSPSLPSRPVTTGIRNSALPKSDPRAEISGEIVWYDALAPRPEVLLLFSSIYGNSVLWVFCLRIRKCPRTEAVIM